MAMLSKLAGKVAQRWSLRELLLLRNSSCSHLSSIRGLHSECRAAAGLLRGVGQHQRLLHPSQSSGVWSAAGSGGVMLLEGRKGLCTTAWRQDKDHGAGGSGKPPDKPDKDDKDDSRTFDSFLMDCLVYYLVLSYMVSDNGLSEIDGDKPFVSWNEFVYQMLARGEVEKVMVTPGINTAHIFLHDGAVIREKRTEHLIYRMNILEIDHFEEKLRKAEASLGLSNSQGIPVEYKRGFELKRRIIMLLGVIAVVALVHSRGGGTKLGLNSNMFRKMTRAKFTHIDPMMPNSGRGVKFSDVAGANEAKQEIREFVDFLKYPDKYRALGAKSPKGALLLGPPGCGKTMLAKAVATEGKVPFLAMNGSEFIEVVGGIGAARVRDLFVEAKKRSPCIIYIDEIDAIGRKRSGSGGMDGSGEMEQTLNQLLVEMDGIGTKEGVVMLASTNRMDMLDKALLRPGRFDRHILLDLPTMKERQEILEHHLKSVVLEEKPSHYSKRLAALTLGFSGAELANVVNEAALYAARNNNKKIKALDLEYAVERVLGGAEKKNSTISPDERRVVAYHEAGHALAGWLLPYTDKLIKVTIIPRTSHALGFAQYQPSDRKLYTQEQISDRMCMALGGRAAESLVFNKITTGARNDLEKVTSMAYAQVRNYGFSPVVGQVSFHGQQVGRRPYSDRLAATIDAETNRIIVQAYWKTEELLRANRDKLEQLAEALLKHETVSCEMVDELWGPPPHGEKQGVDPLEWEGEVRGWANAGDTPAPSVEKMEGNITRQ